MKRAIFIYIFAIVLAGSFTHELFHTYQFGSLGIGTYEMCVIGVHHNGNIGGWTTPALESAGQSEFLEQQRASLESSAYQFEFIAIILMTVGIIYSLLRKGR